ncbi:hypothetical protein Y023_5672 [Burkholderia pseudomallei A79D]|nr:hypothetical protein Y023_5672 [Burkholderia pseudomallei A79D]
MALVTERGSYGRYAGSIAWGEQFDGALPTHCLTGKKTPQVTLIPSDFGDASAMLTLIAPHPLPQPLGSCPQRCASSG